MSRVIVEQLIQSDEKVTLNVDKNITYILVGLEPGDKEIEVVLTKEGVEAKILGLFVLQEGEVKIHTLQHHQAPNATSDLMFKSIVLGNAKFNYQGMIKIDHEAQGSNAYQRNDNLVMHEQALVDTKPELEILANEVRCTHGATVGKLDEEQIYYLMTRGMTREQAVQVLLEGFLGEVIDRVDDEDVREDLRKQIAEALIF